MHSKTTGDQCVDWVLARISYVATEERNSRDLHSGCSHTTVQHMDKLAISRPPINEIATNPANVIHRRDESHRRPPLGEGNCSGQPVGRMADEMFMRVRLC
jgi:hypothetical protein